MATLKRKTQAEIEKGQKKALERFKEIVDRVGKDKKKKKNKKKKKGLSFKIGNKNIARVQIGNQVLTGEMVCVTVEFKNQQMDLDTAMAISGGAIADPREVDIHLIMRNTTGKDGAEEIKND